MKTKVCSMVPRFCLTLLAGLACWPLPAGAQLFENLGLLSDRIVVGNPRYFQTGSSTLGYLDEYPKGLATADLNGDQHADWVVSRLDGKLVFAYGRGDGTFDPVQVMETPASSFRQLIAVDLNGDGRVDLAGCDPFQGILYLFTNNGTRQWDVPATMPVWEGARNLASGDFNGDGITDLITAGPDRDQNYDWSAGKPIDPPPAVPQPLHGVAYLKGSGGGVFATPSYLKEFATVGQPSIDEDDSFPRPVYVLKAWRPAGESRDRLLAGHALSSQLSILTDNGTGTLTSLQTVQALGKGIRAVALGSIYHAAGSGVYDLVVANRDLGLVEVFRGNRGLGFGNTPAAAYPVPTGPRALELADLNGDGWMDLTVVERYGNKLSTWRNTGGGLLEKSGETPTGWSPRELVMADFDEDGRSDFAVLNRTSADVSLHLANPLPDQGLPRTGFKALDQVYPTGGDVAQLAIQDLNNDGRGDILQLHRLSEEISIRMSGPGGKLGPAVFYKMGARPESMSLTDANNDGNQDLVTTNLGDAAGGLYTVRIGDGTGAFGPLVIYRPPPPPLLPTPPSPNPSLPGGVSTPLSANTLFSVISTDLDGDGIDDLVAGYYDCRGVALKGRGDGSYVTPPASAVFSLVYESRYMVHGDFDKDGDEDLAVSGYTGQLLVLENTGNFFLTDPTKPQFIRHPYPGLGGGREIVARDFDGDGDLDLVSASGTGVQVLLGRPGIAFFMTTFPRPVEPEQPPIPAGPPILTAPGLTFAVQTMAWGLFDGDNSWDLATVCKDDGCLRISANTFRDGGGGFKEVLVVDCPLTVNLQAGDVDGDGRTDLAGTGAVLWVALSSRPAQPTLPLLDDAGDRRPSADLVINEIIPGNDTTPINLPDQIEGSDAPAFFSKRPDCVELYNGSAAAIPLAGWKLEYFNASGVKQTFTLPADTIPAKGYRVILCYDKKPVSPWRSGFPIAKEGGLLQLRRPGNALADEVSYPEIGSDLCYCRYSDGDASWRLSSLPNPGFPNVAGSPIEPEAKLHGIDLTEFSTLHRVRFYASASDDMGVLGMSIFWRKAGQISPFKEIPLYDDGTNGDGGRLDGVYAGIFVNPPPGGTPVEFYLQCEDLSGTLTRIPGPPPGAGEESAPPQLYTLVLPTAAAMPRGLEISEMMPAGSTLADPTGVTTNWVEIRNTSSTPISLSGVELADSLFDQGRRAVFPDNITLQPGEHRVVWSRPLGLPNVLSGNLSLGSTNEEITLIQRDASGAQQILSYLQGGRVPRGLAAARIGAAGPVRLLPPTPGLPNLGPQTLIPQSWRDDAGLHFSLIYPTSDGQVPRVEWSVDLDSPNWFPLDSLPGDGLERLQVLEITEPARFFRLRY